MDFESARTWNIIANILLLIGSIGNLCFVKFADRSNTSPWELRYVKIFKFIKANYVWYISWILIILSVIIQLITLIYST